MLNWLKRKFRKKADSPAIRDVRPKIANPYKGADRHYEEFRHRSFIVGHDEEFYPIPNPFTPGSMDLESGQIIPDVAPAAEVQIWQGFGGGNSGGGGTSDSYAPSESSGSSGYDSGSPSSDSGSSCDSGSSGSSSE